MSNEKKSHFTFFLPQSRVLDDSEIKALPDHKKKAAEAAGAAGVWLEVPCPDGDCMEGKGKITLEAVGAKGREDKGVWLNIFCPEDRCLFKTGVELP